ncbi:CPBP family intramembrane metalloprotease [Roseovarius sp. SCSIO 43702]|uniref:CPBP family intramembrane glutamic endopeptidase n=1 Tax=Roseovarius sp. SCSIO 43702 TaxID=2823043 RepID=UPI001C7344D2|nr:type II CAAX endopeptidase family protein [Roseovarius sp. SCSIO 43702]QYX57360.1 CPBP family intramembrane metalloprotease [Roseovarius sp. SCSIO 43702]
MSYEAQETRVAPIREGASPIRFLLGVVFLVPVGLVLSTFILGFLVGALGIAGGGRAGLDAVLAGRDPKSVLILLFSFTGHIAALALVLRLVHRRHLADLLGPVPVAVAQALRVSLFLAVFLCVYALLPAGEQFAVTRQYPFGEWVRYLLPGLLAIFLQVSAEELVFRGYLQSHLAAISRSPIVWMVVPALIFGLLHHDTETYGANAWLIVLWATLFGCLAADVTARAGTLGSAIAMHLANNTLAFLVASPEGHFDGLALYTYDFAMDDPGRVMEWLPQEALATLCIWLCVRVALRR